MKCRVRVEEQVEAFVKSLSPEARQALRRGIKGLAQGRGDTRRLEGKLAAFHRLRVGQCRVIYAERFESGERLIECLFVRERSVVYDIFLQLHAEEFGRSS